MDSCSSHSREDFREYSREKSLRYSKSWVDLDSINSLQINLALVLRSKSIIGYCQANMIIQMTNSLDEMFVINSYFNSILRKLEFIVH